jgi:hypothetical protein
VEAKMAKSQVTYQLKQAFNKLADDHTKRTGEAAPKYRISTPAALALHLLVIRLFRHKREEAAILCAAEQKKTLLRKHFETADRMHAVASNQVRCVSDITKDAKGRIIHVPGTMKMVANTGSRMNPVLWPLNVQRPVPKEDNAPVINDAPKKSSAKKRKAPAKPRASAKSNTAKSSKKKSTKKQKTLVVKKRTVSKKIQHPKKKSKSKKPAEQPDEVEDEPVDFEEENTNVESDDNDGVASSDDDMNDDGGSSSDADFASH